MAEACDAGLERAMRLGRQMLEAAAAGEWERVGALHPECDALLRREHAPDEATRAALQTVQQQHLELTRLAAQARAAAGSALGQHRHKHRALSAYLSTSPPE